MGESPTRQPAPAGSNRSNYGGNEMVEAFGYATTDTYLAVAFGVAQEVLSLDDIPDSEKPKIQDVAKRINRGVKP